MISTSIEVSLAHLFFNPSFTERHDEYQHIHGSEKFCSIESGQFISPRCSPNLFSQHTFAGVTIWETWTEQKVFSSLPSNSFLPSPLNERAETSRGEEACLRYVRLKLSLAADPGCFQFHPNCVLTCDLHSGENMTQSGFRAFSLHCLGKLPIYEADSSSRVLQAKCQQP